MGILKSRLFQIYEQKRKQELADLTGEKKDIAFGSQIRTYTFAPYQIIKDHRTGVEVGNVEAVMDGGLDPFIRAYLTAARPAPPPRPPPHYHRPPPAPPRPPPH